MKWYYKWKLNRIHAEINDLQRQIDVPLLDNYTAHSKLRSLSRLAVCLQERLGQDAKAATRDQTVQS